MYRPHLKKVILTWSLEEAEAEKTVMMKCMVGLVDVDGGELWYDGKIFSGLDKKNANPSVRKLEWFFRVEPYLIL